MHDRMIRDRWELLLDSELGCWVTQPVGTARWWCGELAACAAVCVLRCLGREDRLAGEFQSIDYRWRQMNTTL